MSIPPKVFISATSTDLGSIRQVVKDALLAKGCHPVEQTNFPPDARTVSDMLHERIDECQALIHIVGLRYGFEPDPATLPPGTPRRSFTQMEYHLGRELQAKRGDKSFRVYTFLCPPGFPYDNTNAEPESAEKQELQRLHREALTNDPHLREEPANLVQLRERVLSLQEEMHHLRARRQSLERMIFGYVLVVTLLAIAGLFAVRLLKRDTADIKQDTTGILQTLQADPEQLRTRLRQQIDDQAKTELAAARAANADWRKVAEIEQRREAALGKIDDIILTIQSGLAGKPEPVFLESTRLLHEKGPAEAIAYLESQQNKLLDDASRLTAIEQDIQRRKQEKLRPLLLQADLHESRLAFEPALKLLGQIVQGAPEWADARSRLGNLLNKLARYAEAEPHLRQAHALAPNDNDRAAAAGNLAIVAYNLNRAAEAETLFREAVALYEKARGKDDPQVAIALGNLASHLRDSGRFAEAEPLLRRAIAIEEKAHGKDSPEISTNLGNLAMLCANLNRLEEAETLMRRALTIDETAYGKDHPDTTFSLNNLSQYLSMTGRKTDAEPLMRRLLQISETTYGKVHPDVATALNNLGILLEETGRIPEAEPLLRRALQIDESVHGPNHPEVAGGLNNLAALLKETGRLTEAEPLMRRALQIEEASKGPNHLDVAIKLNNLAMLLRATNRAAEAEPLMRRTLAIDEAAYGKDHPDLAIDLNNLALLLTSIDRATEAEPLMRRAVDILLKHKQPTGQPHPYLDGTLKNYRAILTATGLSESAIEEKLRPLQ